MRLLKGLFSVLVTFGAVNGGLAGATKYDMLAKLFGKHNSASKVVYALVGLAGLYHIFKVKDEIGYQAKQALT